MDRKEIVEKIIMWTGIAREDWVEDAVKHIEKDGWAMNILRTLLQEIEKKHNELEETGEKLDKAEEVIEQLNREIQELKREKHES